MEQCNTEEDKSVIKTEDDTENNKEIKSEDNKEIKTEDNKEIKTENDPYAYLERDFSSEKFKIEIKNMPKFYGMSVRYFRIIFTCRYLV